MTPTAEQAKEAVTATPVRRVRKAYEQVYDQLRDLIDGPAILFRP